MSGKRMIWYDPDPKKPFVQKVTEGIERFVRKFGDIPRYCVVSESFLGSLGLQKGEQLAIESPLYKFKIELTFSADLDKNSFLLIY